MFELVQMPELQYKLPEELYIFSLPFGLDGAFLLGLKNFLPTLYSIRLTSLLDTISCILVVQGLGDRASN
jgi:hypothetical protein